MCLRRQQAIPTAVPQARDIARGLIADWRSNLSIGLRPINRSNGRRINGSSRICLSRDNDLLMVVGPFNEHMIDETSIAGFREWQQIVRDWCHQQAVPCVEPAVLKSSLFGDASHPLTEGYDDLARKIMSDVTFLTWLE